MDRDRWQRPEHWVPLEDGAVQVWRLDLRPSGLGEGPCTDPDADLAALEGWCARLLNPAERLRAERYRVARARTEFTVGRGCLRALLGAELGVAPSAVRLELGPQGKPQLAGGGPLHFNLAHSHGAILIATCRTAPVGVDVERLDDQAVLAEIARDSFAAGERDALRGAGTREQWLRGFYRCWTQKEAVAKGDGRGLTLALPSFEVPIAAPEWTLVRLGEAGYTVVELGVGESFAAAVAVRGEGWTLQANWLPWRALAQL